MPKKLIDLDGVSLCVDQDKNLHGSANDRQGEY